MIGNVGDDDRSVRRQNHLADRVLARQLPNRSPGKRLDPHAALIGKAQQHRIRMKILRRQPGNRVVAGLRLAVQNPRRHQLCQPRGFLSRVDAVDCQLYIGHFHSGPAILRRQLVRVEKVRRVESVLKTCHAPSRIPCPIFSISFQNGRL